ncbi:hypothetical protein R70199_07760 [Paraburkholderia domus]|nr:hypothetical protein R70199_07760 [Paraburkholderia domus]
MSKQITAAQLGTIVTRLLTDTAGTGELESFESFQSFMTAVARVVCDHCGGEVRCDTSRLDDVWYVGVHGNDSLPSAFGGIWREYDAEGILFADDGEAPATVSTSASDAADCKLCDGVDLEQYIRISADSIGELRKVDVYRVISSVRSDNIDGVTRRDLATYIAAKRHDLVAEVTDVMREDFPQDDWTADCVAGREMVPTPDVVHRGWLDNLKEGDRVEVPYSLAKEDIKLMTVFENDGVWIRLLPDGFGKLVDNTVLVDAVSGVLHYASARIVPPGTTNGKARQSRVVNLADGYNGHTIAFFVDPVEVGGETIKLRCAVPGKEYMTAWRAMAEVKAALTSQGGDPNLTQASVLRCNADQQTSAELIGDPAGARLFFEELLASVENLGGTAESHGINTLTDLMYLQQAILKGETIEVWPGETEVGKVLQALSSADRWLRYTELAGDWKNACERSNSRSASI